MPTRNIKYISEGDSGKARVVLSAASRRKPFQRLRSGQVFSNRETSAPYNQYKASRGKMRPGLTKSRHGNGPGDAELSGRQAEDFIQADETFSPAHWTGYPGR